MAARLLRGFGRRAGFGLQILADNRQGGGRRLGRGPGQRHHAGDKKQRPDHCRDQDGNRQPFAARGECHKPHDRDKDAKPDQARIHHEAQPGDVRKPRVRQQDKGEGKGTGHHQQAQNRAPPGPQCGVVVFCKQCHRINGATGLWAKAVREQGIYGCGPSTELR